MKRALMYLVLAVGSMASTAFAQTVANGPYYATPSWDQTLPASTRFIVLANFNSQAVLDRETGLVWQRAPSNLHITAVPPPNSAGTPYASKRCIDLTIGNRKGWRLPSVQELESLIDPSIPFPGPMLPAGHPFQLPVSGFEFLAFWASTESRWLITGQLHPSRFVVYFDLGGTGSSAAIFSHMVWCVRGPGSENPQ